MFVAPPPPFVKGSEIQGVGSWFSASGGHVTPPILLVSGRPSWVGTTTEVEKALLPSQSSRFLLIFCLIITVRSFDIFLVEAFLILSKFLNCLQLGSWSWSKTEVTFSVSLNTPDLSPPLGSSCHHCSIFVAFFPPNSTSYFSSF